MSETFLPALTLVAAIGLTYLFCVRPMRNGRCALRAEQGPDLGADQARREQAEIEAARARLAALRAGQPHARAVTPEQHRSRWHRDRQPTAVTRSRPGAGAA